MDAEEFRRQNDAQFQAFLREWCAENISALGDRVDPSDRTFMAKRRARELSEAALEKAFNATLEHFAKPYGGVLGFVRHLYERAEYKAKYGDL